MNDNCGTSSGEKMDNALIALLISMVALIVSFLTYLSNKKVAEQTYKKLRREELKGITPNIFLKEIEPGAFAAPRLQIKNGQVKLEGLAAKVEFLDNTEEIIKKKILEKLIFPAVLKPNEERVFEINMNPSTRVIMKITVSAKGLETYQWQHEFVRGIIPNWK